jgi:hypothetical protein
MYSKCKKNTVAKKVVVPAPENVVLVKPAEEPKAPEPIVLDTTKKSKIRVVHNVAKAPNIDGYIDDKKVLKNFSYKAVSDYLEVTSGNRHFQVNITDTETKIVDGMMDLKEGKAYTMLIYGEVDKVTPLLIEDNLMCPLMGKTNVRIIHGAATVPDVDIYVNDKKEIESVKYGEVGEPYYLSVNSGTLNVSVYIANTSEKILGPLPLKLDAGKTYTIIATGILKDEKFPFMAIVSSDNKNGCVITAV